MELHERMDDGEKGEANNLQNTMIAAMGNYSKRATSKEVLERSIERFEQRLNELEYKYGMSLPNKPDEFGGMKA